MARAALVVLPEPGGPCTARTEKLNAETIRVSSSLNSSVSPTFSLSEFESSGGLRSKKLRAACQGPTALIPLSLTQQPSRYNESRCALALRYGSLAKTEVGWKPAASLTFSIST